MTKPFHSAALALSVLAAAPALATPRQDGACLVNRLAPADRPAIVADTLAGNSQGTVARLDRPMEACSAGQDWAGARRAAAAAFAIGLVVSGEMRGRLAAHGIDPGAIDRWFARQSDEFRTTAFTTMSGADLEAAFATMVGHEVTAAAMESEGANIGSYVSALVIMERIDRGLDL